MLFIYCVIDILYFIVNEFTSFDIHGFQGLRVLKSIIFRFQDSQTLGFVRFKVFRFWSFRVHGLWSLWFISFEVFFEFCVVEFRWFKILLFMDFEVLRLQSSLVSDFLGFQGPQVLEFTFYKLSGLGFISFMILQEFWLLENNFGIVGFICFRYYWF